MITYYLGRRYVRADLPMAVSNARHNRRQRHMDNDTLVRYAEQALTRPADFGYFGSLDLFRTWGITPIGQDRDSEALYRSNYRRVFSDMRTLAPDEDMGENWLSWVTDFRSSHWAYGWMEQIVARVLYDPDEDITPDNITAPFRHIMEIADYLAHEYPVYDESDYSELESEQITEYFNQEWSALLRRWDDEDGPEPGEDEREFIWSSYDDLSDSNLAYDSDTLAEHVFAERALRIKAAKAAVARILAR